MTNQKPKVVPIVPGIALNPEEFTDIDRLLRDHIGGDIDEIIILAVVGGDLAPAYQLKHDIADGTELEHLSWLLQRAHQTLMTGEWWEEQED